MEDMNIEDLDDERIFLPQSDKKKPSIKEKLSDVLFDKENPEMITYLNDSEIQKIAAIETVVKNENILRKKYGFELNPFEEFLKSLKVHRTSRKGWRSEQAVKIIQSNIEEQEKEHSGFNFGGFPNLKKN